jgi:ABC-type sugar transport system ATPase subunit
MAELKLTNLEKAYGHVKVLHGIDLHIEKGEFIVFVGPSGCGKSTLLRCIAGLEQITDGTLEIDGMVVNDVPPSQRGIAMVFQTYALYPHMTVYDNMAFGLRLAKFSRRRSKGASRTPPKSFSSRPISTACPRRSRAASVSASPSAGRSAAIPRSSSSTSRCPTSMPRCASPPASRSRSSTNRCPTRP